MLKSNSDFNVRNQGDLDGLCGVYSLVHFFMRYRETDSSNVARRLFLEILEGLKIADAFTPERVRNGIGQGKLRQSFERVAKAERVNVVAEPITSYAKRHGCKDLLEVLNHLGDDGAVVAHLPTPQHWVLAHSPSRKTFWIDDSAEGECRRVRDNTLIDQSEGKKVKRKFHLKKGLVLRNAQTH